MASADNAMTRAVLLLIQAVCVGLSVHIVQMERWHVYELLVHRSWYLYSTVSSVALFLCDVWCWIRPLNATLSPSLSFGWCVLWVVHLGVDSTMTHSTRYPQVLMAWLLGLHIARAALLFPLIVARQRLLTVRAVDL